MNVREVWAFSHYPTKLKIPLYTSGVSAGFPSPAEDSLDCRLDLNRWLIDHPAATFCVRVEGDSMTKAHIHDGDVLVVDRMLEADDGDIIVARVGAEMCVKRLRIIEGQVWLYPESDNNRFIPLLITEEMDFCVWAKSWAKGASMGARLIYARSETVTEKPAFREMFKHRRCLIPSDGFYQWARSEGKKHRTSFS